MQIEVRDLRFALYVTERTCLLIDGLDPSERKARWVAQLEQLRERWRHVNWLI